MANRQRGEIEVLLDGVAYTWRLTTNAACALETRTGQKFGDVVAAVDGMSLRAVRDLVWLALQDYHADEFPTAESAGELIDRIGFVAAIEKVRELFEVNQPPAGAQANPQTPAGSGGGSMLRAVGSV